MAVYYLTTATLTGLGYYLTEYLFPSDTCAAGFSEGKSIRRKSSEQEGNSLVQKKRRNTLLYLAVSFLVLTFLASFRYAIGFDYFSYRKIYEKTAASTFSATLATHRHEPLFYLICRIISLSGCSYPVFLLFINTFLIFTAMRFIYRHSRLPWLSVYLFITLQFLAYNMNLLRQSIAVCFFLLAYPCLMERKLLRYSILILVGGLFHNSIFLMWFFYFILTKKHSRLFLVCIAACTLLAYFLFDPVFAFIQPILLKKHANYVNSYYWQPDSFVYVIFPALYTGLAWLFGRNISDPEKRNICLNSALYQGIISLFVTKHFILERFAIYPFSLALIMVPEIICAYRTEKRSTQKKGKKDFYYFCVLFIFVGFGAAYFCFAAVKGFHGVYPYVSLLKRSWSAAS